MADVAIRAEVKWKPLPTIDVDRLEWIVRELCRIIKMDIQHGIKNRRQIDGSPMPALEPATILAKSGGVRAQVASETRGTERERSLPKRKSLRRRGVETFPDHPLIDSGNLLKNQDIEVTRSGNVIEGIIGVGPTRREIAMDLQINGVGKTAKKFYFFGISDTAQERCRKFLEGQKLGNFLIYRN